MGGGGGVKRRSGAGGEGATAHRGYSPCKVCVFFGAIDLFGRQFRLMTGCFFFTSTSYIALNIYSLLIFRVGCVS